MAQGKGHISLPRGPCPRLLAAAPSSPRLSVHRGRRPGLLAGAAATFAMTQERPAQSPVPGVSEGMKGISQQVRQPRGPADGLQPRSQPGGGACTRGLPSGLEINPVGAAGRGEGTSVGIFGGSRPFSEEVRPLRTARQRVEGPGTQPCSPPAGRPFLCVCWPEGDGEGKELSSSLPSCL